MTDDKCGYQDFQALKNLLKSWHVGILYEFFREEDIGINELKMMRYSHINVLLKNYKMGVRIRFEHYFISWRNKIGMPLKSPEINHEMYCCISNRTTGNASIENPHTGNIFTEANIATSARLESERRKLKGNVETAEPTEFDEQQAPSSPQSVNSRTSMVDMLNSNEIGNFMPVSMTDSPNAKANNNSGEEEDMENMPLKPRSSIASESAYDTPQKFPSKPQPGKFNINLKEILTQSGSRGRTILEFFKQNNHLTNIHRTQLIQIVVDYFVKNSYHMSLNMSHNFEWEILKLFPTEKLEYYRTEKRGKLYFKFSNMKRYKRNRNYRLNREIEPVNLRSRRSQTINNNIEVDNELQEESIDMYGKCDEDSYVLAEHNIMVKEENLNDSVYNSE